MAELAPPGAPHATPQFNCLLQRRRGETSAGEKREKRFPKRPGCLEVHHVPDSRDVDTLHAGRLRLDGPRDVENERGVGRTHHQQDGGGELGETTGQAIGRHPDIDIVSFTGSTEVGG